MSSLDLTADGRPDPSSPERPLAFALAIAAALLLHAAVIAWFILGRPNPAADEKPPIPVTLVIEHPPLPPPPAPPFKPPIKPKPALAERESGPDQRTTAPPAAPTPGPTTPAPEPPPGPPAPAQETPEHAPPAGGGKAKEAAPPRPRLEPRREKRVAHAPATRPSNRETAEKEETGDPYLNQLRALIARYQPPTTPIGASGLHLAGIPVIAFVVDRNGTLASLTLERSSGSPLLDQEAQRMVAQAAPFPPVPPSYPAPVRILIRINLFPR